MPVDLTRFKVFKDIAASRSFSRGAALNGISQSAASQHVQELEQELGAVLLDRGTRPLTLTDAGRLYVDFCRDILRRREEFHAQLGLLKAVVDGVVRVAAIYSVGVSEMSKLEQEFRRRHPDATLEVEYLRPEKVYDAVQADRADIGLVSYPEPSRTIAVLPWREEEMAVAASPYHPLAVNNEISPSQLEGLDFIAFDDDLSIRREIDRFLRENHVHVNIALHFDNLQMIKEVVAHGSGISIVPVRAMEAEVAQGRLVPILLRTPLFRPVGIIHRRRKCFQGAAQAFLNLLQEQPLAISPLLATNSR